MSKTKKLKREDSEKRLHDKEFLLQKRAAAERKEWQDQKNLREYLRGKGEME